MSNQNKTKTLLLTVLISSFTFLSVAHSGEPELAKKDEVIETIEAADVDKEVVKAVDNTSIPSEEVLELSSDASETTIEKDTLSEDEKSVEAKEEGKCGG